MKIKTQTKIILLAILLIAIFFLPSKVFAATYGDLTYQIDSKELSITDCNENVTSISIPSKINGYPVTKIAFAAFENCSKLTNITIPNGIKEIGNCAFLGCSSLTNVSVPTTVETIGNEAFAKCSSLQKVTLTSNVETISSGAFSDCINLSDFTIPNGVKKIGSGAFSGCTNLKNIVVPNSVTDCSSAFTNCTGLESLTINAPISNLISCSNCPNLKSVKLPNGIKYIESHAFSNCTSLEEITIPSSVLQVKLGAFSNCTSLKKVTFLGFTTSFDGTYIFDNTPSDMTLYVMKGSVAEDFAINGDYCNKNGFNYKYITIPISNCKISGISNKTYTGKNLTQNITITYENITLKNGTDYTISYSNNKNTGKATVNITGKGSYTGTLTKTFYIVPKKVTGLKAKKQTTNSITLSWSKSTGASGYQLQVYKSSKKKWVDVKITTSTSYKISKLSKGSTYKYRVRAYKTVNNTKQYGSWSSTLNTSTKTSTPKISKVTAGSKKATIQWGKVTGSSGYEIYMSTNKSKNYSKIKTVTNGKTVKYTKTSLKKGKTYYFKIRTYRKVNGKKIYSSYSSVKSIKVK